MQLAFSLIIGLLMGALTGYYAQKRGRNYAGWFFIGMFFGLLGLLALFLLPSLLPEQQKTEESEKISVAPPSIPVIQHKTWYYLDREGTQLGPVDYSVILDLHSRGELSDESYLWSEGMPDWKKFKDLKR